MQFGCFAFLCGVTAMRACMQLRLAALQPASMTNYYQPHYCGKLSGIHFRGTCTRTPRRGYFLTAHRHCNRSHQWSLPVVSVRFIRTSERTVSKRPFPWFGGIYLQAVIPSEKLLRRSRTARNPPMQFGNVWETMRWDAHPFP